MAADKRVCILALSGVLDLAKCVQELLPGVHVENIPYQQGSGVPDEKLDSLKEADILLCHTRALLWCLQNNATPKLKWCQVTSAGIDYVMKAFNFKKPDIDFQMTRTPEGKGALMAEYVLAQILARERHLVRLAEKQTQKQWAREGFRIVRPLTELTIGVLGCGSIGMEVARVCKCMGMSVWGVTRTPRTSQSPDVDHFRVTSDLPEVLHNCDYVCSILPHTPETHDLLSGDVLKHCQERKTVLINIGRGSVISDESLVQALKEGWLGGAILDVFNKEPLPEDSPLWSLPSVVVSPHLSGPSQPDVNAKAFAENYRLYEAGEPMNCLVDWERGY